MDQLPPGFRPSAPPPPTFSFPPSLPLPPPSRSSDSRGKVIAGVVIGVAISVLLCSLCKCRNNRAREAAAAPAAGPLPLTEEANTVPVDERPLHQAYAASPPAALPKFEYTRSVKRNLPGGGEEAAACSVCIGEFQLGETVRLLPGCLHLYHAECIDPWLDAHSTCPNCRAETNQ